MQARDPRPMTTRQVAHACGVELKTVHNWADNGELAHFRTPGKHLRFLPAEVRAFQARHMFESAKGQGTPQERLTLAIKELRTQAEAEGIRDKAGKKSFIRSELDKAFKKLRL